MVIDAIDNYARMAMTQVNLDPNVRNIQELKSWPEFHNAVAAGLRLSSLQVYLTYHMS